MGAEGLYEFVSRVRLEARRCLALRRLTWCMLFESVAECDKVKRFAVAANEQNLDRIEAQLAKMA